MVVSFYEVTSNGGLIREYVCVSIIRVGYRDRSCVPILRPILPWRATEATVRSDSPPWWWFAWTSIRVPNLPNRAWECDIDVGPSWLSRW